MRRKYDERDDPNIPRIGGYTLGQILNAEWVGELPTYDLSKFNEILHCVKSPDSSRGAPPQMSIGICGDEIIAVPRDEFDRIKSVWIVNLRPLPEQPS